MSVLLIDETESVARMSAPLARITGEKVLSTTDLSAALRMIDEKAPTAVVSGLPLTNDLGMTLLLWVSARHPGLPVVVLVEDLTDELAQQAQWFGALGTLAKSTDARALTGGVAAMLGITAPAEEQDPYAAILAATHRHLRLVKPYVQHRIDADGVLAGLFRGFGQVRGHRGTVVLDADGAVLSSLVDDTSLDVRHAASTVHALITECHDARHSTVFDDCRAIDFTVGTDTYVTSCLRDTGHHVHVVTVVADGGNRALPELAHKRMRRELMEVVESAVA